jgi:chemotaxis protein CheX
MKMELIQPFINSADAVLAETMNCRTRIGDLTMEEEAYRRKGVAAVISINGDIEGRVIFDMDPATGAKVATTLAGYEIAETDPAVQETIFELANQVIGNAVTTLNDQGFRFKVHPPELHTASEGMKNTHDTEALVLYVETPAGNVYLNIAMRYNRRRHGERAGTVV